MPNAAAEFFKALPSRSPEPLLGTVRGSLRFELSSGKSSERWLVSVDAGNLSVSQRGGKAACTVRARIDVFERIAVGEVNAFAAVLRGDIAVEGDPLLLVRFQRLLPSPPRAGR